MDKDNQDAKPRPDKTASLIGTPLGVGYKKSREAVAIKFPLEAGDITLEMSLSEVASLMTVSMRCLYGAAKHYNHPTPPPNWPVWKWEAAPLDNNVVHVRFHIIGGGAAAFQIPAPLVEDLIGGLQAALGHPTEKSHRPN